MPIRVGIVPRSAVSLIGLINAVTKLRKGQCWLPFHPIHRDLRVIPARKKGGDWRARPIARKAIMGRKDLAEQVIYSTT